MSIRQTAQRISSNVSSGIVVDQHEIMQKGIMQQLRNRLKTRWHLKQTELTFLDFKRGAFPEQAKANYYALHQAYRKKNKVDLMKLLSVPMYDIFKNNLKKDIDMPFQVYPDVIDAQVVQARQYSNVLKGGSKEYTWHQLTVRLTLGDETGEVVQHSVFERRQSDKTAQDWRICHIE